MTKPLGKYEIAAAEIAQRLSKGDRLEDIATDMKVSREALKSGIRALRAKGYAIPDTNETNGRIDLQSTELYRLASVWNKAPAAFTFEEFAKTENTTHDKLKQRLTRWAKRTGEHLREIPRREHNRKHSKPAQIVAYWREGLSQAEIGQRLGISRSAAGSLVKRLRAEGHPFPRRNTDNAARGHARPANGPSAGAISAPAFKKGLRTPPAGKVVIRRGPAEYLHLAGTHFTNNAKEAYRGTPAQAEKCLRDIAGIDRESVTFIQSQKVLDRVSI